MAVELLEGGEGAPTQEEAETEAVKESGQISVGTGEVSEAGEDHIGGFHLAEDFRATRLSGSSIFKLVHDMYIMYNQKKIEKCLILIPTAYLEV